MTNITLDAVKERQDELAAMITKLEAQWKKPNHFEYQGECIVLNPGEIYVGTITTPGEYGSYHLILLPDACASVMWKQAEEWADEQGGALPNRVEGALLFATQKDEFESEWYWTRESYSNTSAWVQSFSYGDQYSAHKASLIRARAVRRLIIQ